MLKRNIRERKEYLFKKNEEIKSKLIFQKKQQIRDSLENNKPIPPSLKKESDTLLREIQYDDDNTNQEKNILDNEYYTSSSQNPKILMTTSRHPSQRLMQFLQEMRVIIPNSVRVNRGNIVLKDLVTVCQNNEFSDLIILHENRGNPDGLILSHMPYGPTIFVGIFNVILRHDINKNNTSEQIEKISQSFPHLIFDNFKTKVGERIVEIFKNIFPTPKLDSKRVITFYNNNDFVSFRHHKYDKNKDIHGQTNVNIEEIGPRFEMRPYQILLGTIDQPDSKKEWALRPFMNTAKNKNDL